ncbi:MAG TPA: alpha/beta family hydrolase [Bryobacteraceae bacterium]|jgi:dienelactone hydrolase|nr:alpha/beta family hydrolase [Bryobacteraceae bacterium]
MNTVAEERPVWIAAGTADLEASLCVPKDATSIVLFAHGSGSSRHSPRNRYVAQVLRQGGLATLLMDLLTAAEERDDARTARLRFDIDLLAQRLAAAIDWLVENPATSNLRIGLFGASTGAAAAVVAAAERPEAVGAVVSRGGRPDLALPVLGRVKAPTLLIVGSLDHPVIGMNREALAHLQAEKRMEIVAGATHLFEEEGALEEVARLAREWFRAYLTVYT